MAPRTAAAGGGTWSDPATWDEGAAPTLNDDVVMNALSGNVTLSALGKCRTLDCTGYTGTFTMNAVLAIAREATPATTRILTLSSGMTLTQGAGTVYFWLNRSANGARTILTAGKTLKSIQGSGYITLDDALTTTSHIYMTFGDFDTAGHAVTCGDTLQPTSTGAVTLGASAISCKYWYGYAIAALSAGTSTITLTGGGVFWGSSYAGTLDYYNIRLTGGASHKIGDDAYPAGEFRLNSLAITGAGATTITFLAGSTCTLIGSKEWPSGSSGNVVTMQSSSNGSAWNVSCASGTVSVDHVSLKDSAASGGASFAAGLNSTDVSGNSGWTFEVAGGAVGSRLAVGLGLGL